MINETGSIQISVITATWKRPAFLAHVLQQFQMQSRGGLRCEQIVVSDGPDPFARFLSTRWGARYFEMEKQQGHAGAFAKDRGIQESAGDYLVFWDDDNLFAPHALTTLFAAAQGVDLGVVRAEYRCRKSVGMVSLPRRWNGIFRAGDIDTMCLCVRRELALKECWGDADSTPGTDFRWVRKLVTHQPTIRYVPVVIGMHL